MDELEEYSNDNRFIGTANEYQIRINGESNNIERNIVERKNSEISEGMQKYMPIGSVITLKNDQKLLMIVGFNQVYNSNCYDYLAYPYPEGITGNNSQVVFNHEQIERIYNVGYINNQERYFKEHLNAQNRAK